MKLSAFYIAEQIQLRQVVDAYTATLLVDNPSELFYRVDQEQYLYVFDFGVVVLGNMSDVDMTKNLSVLKQYCKNPYADKISDDFLIEHRPDAPMKFHFDSLTVPRLDEHVVRIAMFNLAQSVALDFFDQRGEQLLSDVRLFTNEMEERGGIKISRKNMIKFIGRTLNSKNRIIENLFIFDSPEMTWDDEYLDQVHRGLVRTFELPTRFREVEYTFKVVEDNLAVFRELYMHRESSQLEWIIIILICIEVAEMLITKLF
jgi:required for meiotic nuclear division protein 1